MASARSRNAVLAGACLVAACAIPLSAHASPLPPAYAPATPAASALPRGEPQADPPQADSARATAQEHDTRAALPHSRCVDRAMRVAQPALDSVEVRGTWTARRIPELIDRIKAVTKPCEDTKPRRHPALGRR